MGDQVKNVSAGAHVSQGQLLGYGVQVGRGTPAVHNASPDVDASTWQALITAARQGAAQLAAAAAGSDFGAWLVALPAALRVDVVAAIAACPPTGW